MADDELERIIGIVCERGKIQKKLSPDDDIYDAGLSSLVSLDLRMDLEDAFSVMFDDEAFIHARTPRAIHGLIQSLR